MSQTYQIISYVSFVSFVSQAISRDNYPTSRQLSTHTNNATIRMTIKSAVPRQPRR